MATLSSSSGHLAAGMAVTSLGLMTYGFLQESRISQIAGVALAGSAFLWIRIELKPVEDYTPFQKFFAAVDAKLLDTDYTGAVGMKVCTERCLEVGYGQKVITLKKNLQTNCGLNRYASACILSNALKFQSESADASSYLDLLKQHAPKPKISKRIACYWLDIVYGNAERHGHALSFAQFKYNGNLLLARHSLWQCRASRPCPLICPVQVQRQPLTGST